MTVLDKPHTIPISAATLRNDLVRISLGHVLAASATFLLLCVVAFDQWDFLTNPLAVLVFAVSIVGVLLMIDYVGITIHIRPVVAYLQAAERGDTTTAIAAAAYKRLLNLPFLTVVRIVAFHTTGAQVAIALLAPPIFEEIAGLHLPTWVYGAVIVGCIPVGYTHAMLEYFSVLQYVRPLLPSFARVSVDAFTKTDIVRLNVRLRLLIIGLWISIMPMLSMLSALLVRIEALDPPAAEIQYIALLSVIMIAVVLSFTAIIARRGARDIETLVQSLVQAFQRVEAGDIHTQLPILSSDEFIEVFEGFNQMTHGLQERERLHDAFGRYVSPALAEQIRTDGVQMRGQSVEASVMFCDIRGYTALSQHLSALEVVNMLNTLFAEIEPIIKAEGGWINKFLGDGFMAVFGAPVPQGDHAHHAVTAAVHIQDMLADFNGSHADLPQIEMGIGIDCGDMVAGSIGSPDRIEFTVIGNAVNIASRVEGLNKEFKTKVLITEGVRDNLHEARACRPMPPAIVKGRTTPIQVYAIR